MNTKNQVRKVVIAGGGTAGWMAAASLSRLLGKSLDVVLVESEEIGTVGVGEATIPPIRTLHKLLGIDEQAFLKATCGTFKLGIEFENWKQKGSSYMHSFGITGKECWAGEFHHFWLSGRARGIETEFSDYCFELMAARQGKFGLSQQQPINFAYHFDASLYARFLRDFSEKLGVTRIEGKINQVKLIAETGFIQALQLDSGELVKGDFFIDCTGFRGLLIEQALHTGYEDWSHWLPCDSAVAMQTQAVEAALPYTRATAHEAGWQWRIPLQHRVGNGLVYCSRYLSDDEAKHKLQQQVQGAPLTEPRVIKFKTGRRRKGWNKNCVALGLSAGFVEPLESTSIHLIMTGLVRLMRLFPFGGVEQSAIDEYNQKLGSELDAIRDFIVLHYKVNQRDDSPFWRFCQQMDIPHSLQHKLDLFTQTGRVFLDDGDIFRVDSWTQVMLGQGLLPQQYHGITHEMSDEELRRFLLGLRQNVSNMVEQLPKHQDFIERYCQM